MIVRIPTGVEIVCPTAVTGVPLTATTFGWSSEANWMVPLTVSAFEDESEPAGSFPRTPSAASKTVAVAAVLPVGCSGVTIVSSGSLSIADGMTSSSSTCPKPKSVAGSKSPSMKESPISPTASTKLPPELCGAPAAGSGSWLAISAAMLAAEMLIVPSTICGG